MRLRARRLLGASALALLFSLGVVGCSGDQDTEDGVEASDNNQAADGNGAGDNAASDDNGGGKNAADDGGGGNAAADAGAGDAAAGAETADAAGASGGNATENDLQDIITEMNGQQPAGDGAAATAAAATPPPAGDGEAASAAATPAPAPAPAASAAPAAAKAAPAAAPAAATADAGAGKAASSTQLPPQPGGAPAAPGLPELGSKMAYIVEKGDTMAKISQKVYGSPSHWQEMATLSGLTNPSRIYPGDLVYYTLDESATTFAKAYDTVQRSEEQVKPGDTLATIAQRLYGSSSSWRSIWRHNDNIDNPDVVQPGSTVFYVAKGALQAAIEKVKTNDTKIASQLNNPAHKNLITKNHHKNHHSDKVSVGSSRLVTQDYFTAHLNAIRV